MIGRSGNHEVEVESEGPASEPANDKSLIRVTPRPQRIKAALPAVLKNGGRESGGRGTALAPAPERAKTKRASLADGRAFSLWVRETRPKAADQASSASFSDGRSSSRIRSAISPEFSRMACSILSAIS